MIREINFKKLKKKTLFSGKGKGGGAILNLWTLLNVIKSNPDDFFKA